MLYMFIELSYTYFGTKLSRENEKSHIFYEQMSKCCPFTFGEYVGSTLSIRGRPLFVYPIS